MNLEAKCFDSVVKNKCILIILRNTSLFPLIYYRTCVAIECGCFSTLTPWVKLPRWRSRGYWFIIFSAMVTHRNMEDWAWEKEDLIHHHPPPPTFTHLQLPSLTPTHLQALLPNPTHFQSPLPTFTHLHSLSPTSTQFHPPPPTFIHLCTHFHPPPPTFTHLQLLPTIFTYLHPPPSTSPTSDHLHSHPPTSTHFHPPPPTFNNLHPLSPTSTHLHPLSSWATTAWFKWAENNKVLPLLIIKSIYKSCKGN